MVGNPIKDAGSAMKTTVLFVRNLSTNLPRVRPLNWNIMRIRKVFIPMWWVRVVPLLPGF